MKGWNRFIWVVVAVALALGARDVRAAGGSMAFNGMIAAPTCGPDMDQPSQGSRWHRCGESQPDAQGVTASPYVLANSPLAGGELASDRLVAYLAGYLASAGVAPGEARLITQTFE
ncbi:hypothetical protein [Dyella amyloliquefaciens]|uniref:hypothetical protein n=1 Tax=Dyella amyloliquefaciens TaxID=1770545 RepID=UPI00102E2D9F|nr:hypothetical protein [Dyella amyloliquefaciens]